MQSQGTFDEKLLKFLDLIGERMEPVSCQKVYDLKLESHLSGSVKRARARKTQHVFRMRFRSVRL